MKYGNVCSLKLLNTRLIVLSDARISQEVLGSLHMMNRLSVPIIKTLTGRENVGIGFCNGEVWKDQRRFALSILKRADVGGIRFEEIIGFQAECLLSKLEETGGISFDPHPIIHASVANVIIKIITGITHEYDDAEFCRLLTNTIRVFNLLGPGAGLLSAVPILAAIPSPTKMELTKAWEGIYDFMRQRIEIHKLEFDPNQEATDFIGSYLQEMARRKAENGQGSFDEINLMVCCFDLLVAGQETVSTNILWSLHTLASHPDAQRRVRREIIDVVGQKRLPQYSDHHRMPATMATIAECMRFRPAVSLLPQHVATEDCKIGEYDVPKGSVITTNLWHLAQSPALWDKPLEFRPDRFLTEDGKFDRTKEPVLFGTGRRVCPGEHLARTEVFLHITYILQRFTVRLSEGVPKDLSSRRRGLTNSPDPYQIHVVKDSL